MGLFCLWFHGCFNSRLSVLETPAQRGDPLDNKDTCHRFVPSDTDIQLAQLEWSRDMPGLDVGWKAGYSCTLFHSFLSSLPQSQTRPQEQSHPISFSRQIMQVNAGRYFLFLETPAGAFSFKSFSSSLRKLLLEVAIIHSMSHFNKKTKFAFLERGGKHKVGMFGLEPVEQCSFAQGWPPASLFLLQDNGSSEASAETGNQHAGKSEGCVRTALEKIHAKHSPGHNTTKKSGALKSEE